jgi:hypothetical protein
MSSSDNQGGVVPTISAIDGLLRTVLATAVVAGLGYAGYYGYTTYNSGDIAKRELQDVRKAVDEQQKLIKEKDIALAAKDTQLADKETALKSKDTQIAAHVTTIKTQDIELVKKVAEIKKQAAELKRLDTALRLLKVDHRLARITVLEQKNDPATMEQYTKIQYVEVDDKGKPIDEPRVFRLKGDMVFVDYWVVKFEDKYIETADLARSTSICLFRRIFGEQQKPSEGYLLDEPGTLPKAYGRGAPPSEFERKIWDDFWNIANDPAKAAELGIRAAHGEAANIKLMPGKQYRVELRATGDISIKAESVPAPTIGDPG